MGVQGASGMERGSGVTDCSGQEKPESEQSNTHKFSALYTPPPGLASLACNLPLPPAVEKVPRARGVTQPRPVGSQEEEVAAALWGHSWGTACALG